MIWNLPLSVSPSMLLKLIYYFTSLMPTAQIMKEASNGNETLAVKTARKVFHNIRMMMHLDNLKVEQTSKLGGLACELLDWTCRPGWQPPFHSPPIDQVLIF